MKIKPIPTKYNGVMFRSRLEASWAMSLDAYSIKWEYEPEGYELPSGTWYEPDFYLPEIRTWLEVKGPHNERLHKVAELRWAVAHETSCTDDCSRISHTSYWDPWRMVIIGTPARDGNRLFATVPDCSTASGRCRNCHRWQWTTYFVDELCRHCGAIGQLDEWASIGHRGKSPKFGWDQLGMRFYQVPR